MAYVVIGLFFALTLAVGLCGRSRSTEFFLAGRRAGAATVGGSLLATCLGGSATLGIVGKAYDRGWSAFWWLGAGAIGLFLLGAFWARSMRGRSETRTLPEWAGHTYGVPARFIAALLIVVMWVGVVAAQFVAAGAILTAVAGWPVGWTISIAAAIAVFYTCWGGQQSVLRTDVLQVFMIVGAIVLPALFLWKLPGLVSLPRIDPRSIVFPRDLSLFEWGSLVLVVGGMYVVGPDLCSRVLVARDNRAAQRGAWLAAGALLVCSVMIVCLGVALRESGVEVSAPRSALPSLVQTIMPAPLALLVNLGLIAALLSSADTCLLTASSVLELDVISRMRRVKAGRVWRARLFLVGIGILAALLAIVNPRIIGNIMLAYAFYAGGLLVPLLLLRFPSLNGRVPRPWVWASMVAGGVVPVMLLLSNTITASDFMLRMACAGTAGATACAAILVAGIVMKKVGARSSRIGSK